MVGLFGGDLTAFLEDCAAAEDDCDVAEYAGLSGWAIGVEWTPVACTMDCLDNKSEDSNYVIFEDRLIGSLLIWA